MTGKSLKSGLVAVPAAALAVAVLALGASAFGGGSDVAAPAVDYAAVSGPAAAGLAPTTTSRDWDEVRASAARPRRGRF